MSGLCSNCVSQQFYINLYSKLPADLCMVYLKMVSPNQATLDATIDKQGRVTHKSTKFKEQGSCVAFDPNIVTPIPPTYNSTGLKQRIVLTSPLTDQDWRLPLTATKTTAKNKIHWYTTRRHSNRQTWSNIPIYPTPGINMWEKTHPQLNSEWSAGSIHMPPKRDGDKSLTYQGPFIKVCRLSSPPHVFIAKP